MRNFLKKWLKIDELEQKVNETSNVVASNAAEMSKDVQALYHELYNTHTKIALFDGRIKEMELSMHLMSTKEVAEILEVSPRTVQNYCNDGKLIAEIVGGQWVITELELKRYQSRLEKEKED